MIRVNLLPIKQARRRSAGRAQLVIFAVLVFAEIALFGFLWFLADYDVNQIQSKVADYEQQVNEAKREVKDAKQLEQRKAQLEKQLGVLDELEAQRSGPVRVLDEIQAILSPPRNEEDRFARLQKNWNVDWEPRRLYIQSFSENEGKFTLEGTAVNADDVAEFLQRLTTARHFQDVELDIVEAQTRKGQNVEARMVSFKIHGTLSYRGSEDEEKGTGNKQGKKKKKGS